MHGTAASGIAGAVAVEVVDRRRDIGNYIDALGYRAAGIAAIVNGETDGAHAGIGRQRGIPVGHRGQRRLPLCGGGRVAAGGQGQHPGAAVVAPGNIAHGAAIVGEGQHILATMKIAGDRYRGAGLSAAGHIAECDAAVHGHRVAVAGFVVAVAVAGRDHRAGKMEVGCLDVVDAERPVDLKAAIGLYAEGVNVLEIGIVTHIEGHQ